MSFLLIWDVCWYGGRERELSAYQRRIGARRGDGRRCGKKGGCTLAAVEKPLTVEFMFVEVFKLWNRGESVYCNKFKRGILLVIMWWCCLCCVWYVGDGCKQLQCVKEKLRLKHLEFIP